MTIDINELRMQVHDFKRAGSPMLLLQTTQMGELLDRLEAAEQTVKDYMRIDKEKAQLAQRIERLEEALSEIAWSA